MPAPSSPATPARDAGLRCHLSSRTVVHQQRLPKPSAPRTTRRRAVQNDAARDPHLWTGWSACMNERIHFGGMVRGQSEAPEEKLSMSFTAEETAYLRSQPLARLATLSAVGQPDVVPFSFEFDGECFWVGGSGASVLATRRFRKRAGRQPRSRPGRRRHDLLRSVHRARHPGLWPRRATHRA